MDSATMEENIATSDRDANAIIIQKKKNRAQKKAIIVPSSMACIERGYMSSNVRLQSVTIPSSVTYLGEAAFEYCSSLQTIIIPDSVTYIGAFAFNSCRSLTTIIIPKSVFTIRVNAFENCTSLESIIIPKAVRYVGDYAFSDCSSLKSIVLPKEIIYIGRSVFDSCYALDQRNIEGHNYQFSTEKWLQNRFCGLPIHQACYENANEMTTERFTLLIEENKHTLNEIDAMGMTPLHILHCNPTASKEMFQILKLAYPEAIAVRDINGMSPLMIFYTCKGIKTSSYFDSFSNGPSLCALLEEGVKFEQIQQLIQYDDEMIFLTEMKNGHLDSGLYPFMFAASSSHNYDLDVIVELVLEYPEVFQRFVTA